MSTDAVTPNQDAHGPSSTPVDRGRQAFFGHALSPTRVDPGMCHTCPTVMPRCDWPAASASDKWQLVFTPAW